jgi:hypothetical protein
MKWALLPARLATSAAATPATAAAAATGPATAAAPAKAAATARRRRLGPGLVDRQGTPAELRLVQFVDCLLGIVRVGHFDKRKATRTPRGHVAHDPDRVHRADPPEELFELGLAHLVWQVSNEQPTTHVTDFPGTDGPVALPLTNEEALTKLA